MGAACGCPSKKTLAKIEKARLKAERIQEYSVPIHEDGTRRHWTRPSWYPPLPVVPRTDGECLREHRDHFYGTTYYSVEDHERNIKRRRSAMAKRKPWNSETDAEMKRGEITVPQLRTFDLGRIL
jgi:hypothetical protein